MAWLRRRGLLVLGVAAWACAGEHFTESTETTSDSGTVSQREDAAASNASLDGQAPIRESGVGGRSDGAAASPNVDGGVRPIDAGGDGSGGTGGIAGAGGKAGADAAAGSGGALNDGGGTGGMSPGICPPDPPKSGADCDTGNLSCDYGQCCKIRATCDNDIWSTVDLGCPPSECPDTPPTSTGECECQPGLQCIYDRCTEASNDQLVAQCDDAGQWKSTTTGCGQSTFECGSGHCFDGQICVTHISAGPTLTHSCEDSPCADFVQCSCAEQLCSGKLCTDSPGANILCGAP